MYPSQRAPRVTPQACTFAHGDAELEAWNRIRVQNPAGFDSSPRGAGPGRGPGGAGGGYAPPVMPCTRAAAPAAAARLARQRQLPPPGRAQLLPVAPWCAQAPTLRRCPPDADAWRPPAAAWPSHQTPPVPPSCGWQVPEGKSRSPTLRRMPSPACCPCSCPHLCDQAVTRWSPPATENTGLSKSGTCPDRPIPVSARVTPALRRKLFSGEQGHSCYDPSSRVQASALTGACPRAGLLVHLRALGQRTGGVGRSATARRHCARPPCKHEAQCGLPALPSLLELRQLPARRGLLLRALTARGAPVAQPAPPPMSSRPSARVGCARYLVLCGAEHV